MKEKKIDIGLLDDILGNDYPKMNDLVDTRFILHLYSTETVKGYKTPSVKYEVEVDKTKRDYYSFSTILLSQVEKIEKKVGFPVPLSIAERKSKEGNDYLTFVKAIGE